MAQKNPVDPLLIQTMRAVLEQHGQGSGLESRLQKLLENIITGEVPDEDIREIIDSVKLVGKNGR